MKVEVKGNQSQEVDWTKNPQLVVDENGGVVLATKGNAENDEYFTGVGLCGNRGMEFCYTKIWVKSQFKPFHGEITLKND